MELLGTDFKLGKESPITTLLVASLHPELLIS